MQKHYQNTILQKQGCILLFYQGWGSITTKNIGKFPFVWGAIGTGVGVIVYNDKQYKDTEPPILQSLMVNHKNFLISQV